MAPNHDSIPAISVSYRGKKIDISLSDDSSKTVRSVQDEIVRATDVPDTRIKLLFQGKHLSDLDLPIRVYLESMAKRTHYKLLATGVSLKEAQALDEALQTARRTIRIRDDLTEEGRKELAQRQRLGQFMLHNSNRKGQFDHSPYRFGRIEILPNLPNQERAREILTSLANDPGILACMRSHQWSVGALAELYPDGKVGQSAVCVMGLNENKGQRILLRIRTDDLKGFRKMTSIRKVLYHELAHNVHSEHDDDFFRLMRQIERDCTSMDWTGGAGLTSASAPTTTTLYSGGSFRLGGGPSPVEDRPLLPVRELAAQAAMARMTREEEEIEQHCGCGRIDLFLPQTTDTMKRDPNERRDQKHMDSEES